MNFEINKVMAERYLGTATYEDYVDWAVACLESGLDTKTIRILASLRNVSSPSEVEDYFNRSLKDLDWTMPEPRKCLFEYARGLAQQIVSGDLSPLVGCGLIYQITFALEFPGEMHRWVYLDDGLHPDNYGDLEGADLDDAIKSEAARFVKESEGFTPR